MHNAYGEITFERVVDAQHNGVIVVDKDGYITTLNKAAEKILGFKSQYAVGKYIKDLVPNSGMIKILQNPRNAHYGRKFTVGDKVYMVNRSPMYDGDKLLGAVATLQEITELQNVIDEIESVKELKGTLEIVLESAYDGIVVINKDGIIIMLNGVYASYLGVDPQEVIGKHVSEVLGENTSLLPVLRSGHAKVGEIIWLNEHEVIATSLPVKKSGHIIGAVGKIMFKDVRELDALSQKVYSLRRELRYYQDTIERYRGARYTVKDIVGESPEMLRLKELVEKVGKSSSTVLIRGESGTGKELFAHAIHLESNRRLGPFIKVNCAAIPESLLESELFGYVDGAFTGAKKGGQQGKFLLANKGTIFLDEIGDMPLAMQGKILRILQEKEVEPLGGNKSIPVDVRVIAATNRPLEDLVSRGSFRQDLYYRLNVFAINILPLRERKGDIALFVKYYIDKFNREFGARVKQVSPEVNNLFMQYHWPGNVREMENVLERAFNMVEGEVIFMQHLPAYLQQGAHRFSKGKGLAAILGETERTAIIEALAIAKGNKSRAANHLGISRAWLYERLEKYGIG